MTDLEPADTVAANRRLDPLALSSSLKRDLDWIVMKTLEKDRTRRYDTALELAQEIGYPLVLLRAPAETPREVLERIRASGKTWRAFLSEWLSKQS